jgi:hypothetical protein
MTLAEHGIVGPLGVQEAQDLGLGVAVGIGHRIRVGRLVGEPRRLDRRARAQEVARRTCGALCQRQQLARIGHELHHR